MTCRAKDLGIEVKKGIKLASVVVAIAMAFLPHATFGDESQIRLEPYKNFEKDWKLVTVRYRKDTGELRFTYANPVAWRHLEERLAGKTSAPYPKGAVFAKTGIATSEDVSFPSSAVPGGVRRFQLMIRDEKKYAHTDGWGYALYTENGKMAPGNAKQAALACAACHKIVPERDFVFSVPMSGLVPKSALLNLPTSKNWSFRDTPSGMLPKNVSRLLPIGSREVRQLEGEISKHVFEGTLDEVRPLLTKEVVRSGKPAMLLSQNGKHFSLVYAKTESEKALGSKDFLPPQKGCGPDESVFLAISGAVDSVESGKVIQFCHKGE